MSHLITPEQSTAFHLTSYHWENTVIPPQVAAVYNYADMSPGWADM